MLDKGRIEDLNLLKKAYNLANTDIERQLLDDVANHIINEPKWIRDAREALIREKRAGRDQNVKDINYQITKRQDKFKI
ncbi:MAG: hypothetical protein LC109_09940 [Bacteroidia bacterium]|jgi:hypothetical protein|nr:hypothetical protein [Bacteroidia bacterium]